MPGPEITDPTDQLIRRGWRSGQQKHVFRDQITGVIRAPAATFDIKDQHKYMSVNIKSLLDQAGKAIEWGCDLSKSYICALTVEACQKLQLPVTHEPVLNDPNIPNNPFHGAVRGMRELRDADIDEYDNLLHELSKAAVVIGDLRGLLPL